SARRGCRGGAAGRVAHLAPRPGRAVVSRSSLGRTQGLALGRRDGGDRVDVCGSRAAGRIPSRRCGRVSSVAALIREGRLRSRPSHSPLGRSYFFFSDLPSIVAPAPEPTVIRFGFGCSGFFTCTSRTPFLYSAEMSPSVTPCVTPKVRENVPKRRSKR